MKRRQLLAGGAGMAASGFAGFLRAQSLPGNAMVINAFPPGGIGDHVARPLAEKMRGAYAANVLVESRPGAGGRIAVEYVKRAAPDGLTILQIPTSVMTLYPSTYKKLNYDVFTDFVPVTTTVPYEFSFTAGPGLPAEIRTVAEYVQWAKANPKLANYGIPAAGSALHFAGMMLARASGTDLRAVAYRGGAPLLSDLMGGQVPVSFNVVGEVLPQIKAGRLRSLGMTTAVRSTFLPDVPTLAEQGYKDIVVSEYLAWFLPARTPMEIVKRLNTQVREGIQSPEHLEILSRNALRPVTQSPEEFAQMLRQDAIRWTAIAKATGFTAED